MLASLPRHDASVDASRDYVGAHSRSIAQADGYQGPQTLATGTNEQRNSPGSIDCLGEDGHRGVSQRKTDKGGARRRITRACDQCNQLRTKCDGQKPCAHCLDLSLTCEYERERKKRGKVSKKDIAARQAVTENASDSDLADAAHDAVPNDIGSRGPQQAARPKSSKRKRGETAPGERVNLTDSQAQRQRASLVQSDETARAPGLDAPAAHPTDHPLNAAHTSSAARLPSPTHMNGLSMDALGAAAPLDRQGYEAYPAHLHDLRPGSAQQSLNNDTQVPALLPGSGLSEFGEMPYALPPGGIQPGIAGQPFGFRSPLSASLLRQSPMAGSPGWLSLPSPSASMYANPHLQPPKTGLRYPVLQPLIPHVSAIMPISLACDLLELYFSSSSKAIMSPQSPYVLAYVLRKHSLLRQDQPRSCSPALLASMLWIAAQTSESAYLTSPPAARGRICQKLLDLAIGLLHPLIHAPSDGENSYGGNTLLNGIALGGFGVALPGQAGNLDGGLPGATGALDDVATYMHLATVVSASEYKAASLRWWNAAWSLARELKLGRELPLNPTAPETHDPGFGTFINGDRSGRQQPGFTSEEEREERRRIWWLLYSVDRHLALCYNRPLFLLDAECDGLLQPVDEMLWQSGERFALDDNPQNAPYRPAGQVFECTGHNMYSWFLPLMTILGEIIDLNQARNHPRFGRHFNSDEVVAQITQQLETYAQSLKQFDIRYSELPESGAADNATSPDSSNNASMTSSTTNVNNVHRISDLALQTRIVVAYGTHLIHTLHILLNGKWDPLTLLDDADLWISSRSFVAATGHAVAAAAAVDAILEHDPDLSRVPFFFGIYLLQGSFLLLLIADKLAGEASGAVVRACESIVRAHEACVVTLNTEYQRNFRKVMRSALAQVRGRQQEDYGEQQARRREVLSLYRWTSDGTGLAL